MSNEADNTDEWDEIGFVISSKYRIAVLETLATGPSIPSSIAAETGLPITHVSRALRALRERSLVELLVSKQKKKGRIYGMTERGQQLWKRIEAEGLID
ncbi:winged helix-turn-helix domain-containing protein [Halobellus ordinarius]|jgi:DNA-binding MarR family transcriptional regulator|uniref:winged helix-turn-helix domain-containing protein n=1 Tax=Halobellus ordinarius TaxID=3075120 RepID=UPI00288089AA|nr:winged helix-turn-helix domain-containing protein [Halobellus sp. ZY16]